MSCLTFTKIHVPGADLGPLNCLPDIKNDSYIRAPIAVSDRVSEEEKALIGKGMIPTLLPYELQSEYNRERKDLALDGAILENEFLKATFIPALGGRLWSLFDKKAGRELLYANNVFQPCNLALRNAWFSGGVEWNVGIKGHNPLTASPLFAKKMVGKDGEPILRMYEFERIREITYAVEAKLVEDLLLVRTTMENSKEEDTWMYWWSNIAVDETPGTRVIVPTTKSFVCAYDEGRYFLDNTDLPIMGGKDVTYSGNLERSRDFFYKIPDTEKKWVTALKEDGYGLIQLSDHILKGRKLFAWGQGQGGKHWNNWLSDLGRGYIEIQAGLLRTQLEHFLMKGESKLSWTEGYGALQADPGVIHGSDYTRAIEDVKSRIEAKQAILENADFGAVEEGPVVYLGSGWGYVESRKRGKPVSDFLEFPAESVNEETRSWNELLSGGDLPERDPLAPIPSYVKGQVWIDLLEAQPDSWYKFCQLGVCRYTAGDVNGAMAACEASIRETENPWAWRNISQIERNEFGNIDAAVAAFDRAVALNRDYRPLVVNYAETLIGAGLYAKWRAFYEGLSDALREDGRLKMLYAFALLDAGEYRAALDVITKDFRMPDIKEGEFSVSHLWLAIHKKIMEEAGEVYETDKDVFARYPLPYELD
ncbi:MAG: DUF5107 domain-containing protein, partial [Clostridia bacterium]|nr:DUF5107 domain-containing protein [Clostridia bacterium]